jgi:AraC-like DNA-binding protein
MPVVAVRSPSPALARYVSSFDYIESDIPTSLERILPAGRIHLMVNLCEDEFRTYHGPDCATIHRTHGAVLTGPFSQPSVIDTKLQRRLVIVNFNLGGASPFFASPLSEAHDQLVELDHVWGRDGAVLRERLLESRTPEAKLQVIETVLLDHLVRPQEPDPAIRFAASAFDHGIPVSAVAEGLGLLPKTFVRRFRKHVGLTPKSFSRLRRLQRVVRSISKAAAVDWADFAAEHGYTDQAHLIHDFRELTGITPAAYRPRSPGEHNHVPVATSTC